MVHLLLNVSQHEHNLSHYPGWIHLGEFSCENLVRKITFKWKAFGFFTSPTILHNLVHSLIVHSKFLGLTPMIFFSPLSLWCAAGSCWDHGNIFSTLTFFTFLFIFITSSQTWIKYLNFILLNEIIIMLYISLKLIKCAFLINTCLYKGDILWNREKLWPIDLTCRQKHLSKLILT